MGYNFTKQTQNETHEKADFTYSTFSKNVRDLLIFHRWTVSIQRKALLQSSMQTLRQVLMIRERLLQHFLRIW